MCDGKWLMRERKLLTLDEEAIYTEAQKRADDIRARAGIVLPPRFKMN
jgi:5-methylthioadenosine/S-adenosylhomocysteine deaminase